MTLSLSTEVFACYIYLCVPSNIFHQHHHHLSMSTSQTTVVKAAYWVSSSGQLVSDINSNLFTHLFCAFADLNPTTYEVTISSQKIQTFTQTVQKKNTKVQTLLSIGGGDESTFANMARSGDAVNRQTFIKSSIKVARANSFDGLELYWEYPKTEDEMTTFGQLITEWRSAVTVEAATSKKTPLLLTATVFRRAEYCTIKYPFSAVSASLDWINVKSYDYYCPTSDVGKTHTYPPAALYGGESTSFINGDDGIGSWITALSANKIVIGLPFFGYSWKLKSPNYNGFKAPANGPGSGTTGYESYRDIILIRKADESYVTEYNDDVVSNYCYSKHRLVWIGYDDTESIIAKVSYAKEKQLLGYFAWHTGADTPESTLSKQAFDTWGSDEA